MLIVLRHAQTEWNAAPKRCQGQTDVPLSDEGRCAATTRGQSLLDTMPTAAHSSHLSRARETAELVLAATSSRLGLEPPRVETDRRLSESFCGQWEGRLHDDVVAKDPELWAKLRDNDSTFAFPGGESCSEVLARFERALGELDDTHRGELALVVTHGGPMRLYLAAHHDPRGSTLPGSVPHNLEGFRLDGGAIELLEGG